MNKEFFINPEGHSEYCAVPFWFWNDTITDEKLKLQLDLMKHNHFTQVLLHARSGLTNEYLSDDWFDRIRTVVDYAKENDGKVWLYDENNWPSGTCSGTVTKDEANREKYLRPEYFYLKAGETFQINARETEEITVKAVLGYNNTTLETQCPSSWICFVAYPDGQEAEELMSQADDDGNITYTAATDTCIVGMRMICNTYEPFGRNSVDYMNKAALKQFIDSTHEKYREHFEEDFGNVIRGIFMDETRFFDTMPWTVNFPEEFKARKGYDILPLLPLLFLNDKASAEKTAMVRYDYRDVTADLMAEATFKQIYDWGEANNMQTTGHLLGEESMMANVRYNSDIMRMYHYFHIPGIDHLGNGIGSMAAKYCVSAAHNYGKNIISTEAFGASGWDMTYESMVKISNWLFQQGINLIMMHGFYYSIRDERSKDWPPSYFYQWKYWDHMHEYAQMAKRMTYMLQGGVSEMDVLVYYPVETFWAHKAPDTDITTCFFKDGPKIEDETAAYMDYNYQYLCSSLDNKNLEYDIFNADAAENFKAEGGRIVNRQNGMSYGIFILPFAEILPDATARLLNDFMDQGGIVISHRSTPQIILGKHGEHMNESAKSKLCKLNIDGMISINKVSDVVSYCASHCHQPYDIRGGIAEKNRTQMSYPKQLHDPYIHDGEQVYGIGVTRYLKDEKRIINVTNYNNWAEDLEIFVESRNVPELFIPETGEIKPQSDAITEENGYLVKISVPANRAYFIVCD